MMRKALASLAALAMVAVVPGERKAVMVGSQGLHHIDVFLPGGVAIVAPAGPAEKRQTRGELHRADLGKVCRDVGAEAEERRVSE